MICRGGSKARLAEWAQRAEGRTARWMGLITVVAITTAAAPTAASARILVFANGYPMSPGSGPTAIVTDDPNPGDSSGRLTIENPRPNELSPITSFYGDSRRGDLSSFTPVDTSGDNGPNDDGYFGANPPVGYCGPGHAGGAGSQRVFTCELTNPDSTDTASMGEIGGGLYESFDYQGPVSGLADLFLWFDWANLGPDCKPQQIIGGPRQPRARTADSCTTPSTPQITSSRIDQRRHTASFKYTARYAKSYLCTLLRNNRLMFRRSCGSRKDYANRLPKGQYQFVVAGVNHAGQSSTPGVKTFQMR